MHQTFYSNQFWRGVVIDFSNKCIIAWTACLALIQGDEENAHVRSKLREEGGRSVVHSLEVPRSLRA